MANLRQTNSELKELNSSIKQVTNSIKDLQQQYKKESPGDKRNKIYDEITNQQKLLDELNNKRDIAKAKIQSANEYINIEQLKAQRSNVKALADQLNYLDEQQKKLNPDALDSLISALKSIKNLQSVQFGTDVNKSRLQDWYSEADALLKIQNNLKNIQDVKLNDTQFIKLKDLIDSLQSSFQDLWTKIENVTKRMYLTVPQRRMFEQNSIFNEANVTGEYGSLDSIDELRRPLPTLALSQAIGDNELTGKINNRIKELEDRLEKIKNGTINIDIDTSDIEFAINLLKEILSFKEETLKKQRNAQTIQAMYGLSPELLEHGTNIKQPNTINRDALQGYAKLQQKESIDVPQFKDVYANTAKQLGYNTLLNKDLQYYISDILALTDSKNQLSSSDQTDLINQIKEQRSEIEQTLKEVKSHDIVQTTPLKEVQDNVKNIESQYKELADTIKVQNESVNKQITKSKEELVNYDAKLKETNKDLSSKQSISGQNEYNKEVESQINASDKQQKAIQEDQKQIRDAVKSTEKAVQEANNEISNKNAQKSVEDQAKQIVKSQSTIQSAFKNVEQAHTKQKNAEDAYTKQVVSDAQKRQEAYQKYTQTKQINIQNTDNLKQAFDKRQADFNKLDTSGLDRLVSRANIARDALKSAFDHGADINKLNSLWAVYVNSTDKVIGRIKAREMAESQAIQKNIAEVRNYVQTQETLTGKKMQSSDQAAYYDSQLSKFKQSQQEYMEVLRLKRNAEAQAAADTRNAWSTILSSVKQAADAINNAVNKIISVIRTVIQIYQKFGKAVVTVFKTVGGSVKNLLTFFSGFGNRLRSMFTGGTDNANKFNKSFGLIQGTATELRSKLLLVSGALNQIFNNELINKAKRLLSSVYQLKTMTGPAITQDVIDWANSMEHAFGLQARGLIADLSELTGVLYGLGMSGEDVAIGSENLLIMSRYLANMGAAGGDLNTVMSKIVSGMKGMTQSIDDLGLSVRDAQMNAFLKDLKAQGGEFANISTDFSSLNEQARVYVRYAALINQFTRNYDVTKLVESLNTVTGRLNTLKDTWNSLTLTIGTGLTKLASMAATYIIPILKIIENKVIQLFGWLEKTLGLAEGQLSAELTPSINDGASEAVNDYNEQLGETADKLDEVNKASKKASGGLQSFDRINNVTTSKSSDSSQGLDDFDYSSLMTSMLGKLNDMAAQASQSFFEGLNQNLENKIEELKQKLLDYAKNITGRANIDFGFDEKAIKTNLTKVKNDIIKIVKSWGTFVLAIGFKIADDVNIGAIITKVTELLAAFTNLASTMTDVLIPAFNAFYDTGLSKMFTWLGSTALNGLQLLIDTFNDWSDWFVENQTLILNFFTALGTIFSSVWTVISGKLDSGFGSLSEQFKAFTDDQQSGLVTWMTDIVTNVDSIASDASTKVSNFLDTVGTKLEWVSDLISGALETLFTGQVPEDATGGYASFYNILLDIKSVVDAIGGGIGIALGLQSPEEASDGALTFYNLLVNVQSIIQTLTPLVLDLVEAFNDFAAENILPFINDKLTQLDTWLKNNSDKVKTLLETVGNIAWDGFTLFVDFTGKLIDYVVQNPESVVTFFSGLLALKVGSWFVSGAAGIGSMTLGLTNLGTAVSTVGPQISAAFAGINTALSGTVFGSASAALGGLVSPLTLVVALVVGLVAAFVDLWNTSEDFRAAFAEMADTLKSKIDALAKQFGEGSKFSDALKHLKSLYDTYLKPVLQVLFEIVGYLATGVLGTLIDWIGLLVGGAQQVLDGLLTQLEGFIDLFVGFLTKDDAKMQEGLLKIGEGLLKIVQSIFGTLIGLLGQLVSNLLDFLWNAGKQIIDKVKEVFGITSISSVFADIGKKLIDGLKNGISNAWKSFTTFINTKIDGFKKIFEDFADSVGGFFDDIWTGFTDGVSAGWSTVTGAVTDGWNFITGKTKASNAQSITSHANGGSIAGGHLFIANENGVPEMIGKIPGSSKTNVANNQMITDAIFEAVYNAIAEASNQRASVGSTNNSPLGININGFGLIDQSTLQALARMLAPYLGANNRNIANVNFSI